MPLSRHLTYENYLSHNAAQYDIADRFPMMGAAAMAADLVCVLVALSRSMTRSGSGAEIQRPITTPDDETRGADPVPVG